MSLTVSLIAVLIPLLFMGDITGRLFREFAVTLSATILISAAISLTLTPMLCAKLLKHQDNARAEPLLPGLRTDIHRASSDFYERTLDWVLERRRLTLAVAVGTLVVTVFLYLVVPKGFFPVQDTGEIQAVSEAAQTVSFAEMAQLQQRLTALILENPAVDSLSSFIGVDGTNTTLNSGPHPDQPEAARGAQIGDRGHRGAVKRGAAAGRHHICTCSRCRTSRSRTS